MKWIVSFAAADTDVAASRDELVEQLTPLGCTVSAGNVQQLDGNKYGLAVEGPEDLPDLVGALAGVTGVYPNSKHEAGAFVPV